MKKKAVRPISRLDREISVPGSKSLTARALVIGALASGETLLKSPLFSEDTECMIEGLRSLGVEIEQRGEDLVIMGTGGLFHPTKGTLCLKGAGTAVRFLTTVASLSNRPITIDGNGRMRERPIQDLLEGLHPLGIEARSIHGNGCPPILIEGGRFEGGHTLLRGEKSSQFLSSILLCSPYAQEEVVVEMAGDLVSRSYADLTMEVMREFGGEVSHTDYRVFRVTPGMYQGRDYDIEGDLSSASYFFAAAAITGGRILVKGVNPSTRQGEAGLVDLLESMGCKVHRQNQGIEVIGGDLHGVDVDMNTMPDAVPTLAVVAAFARGTTRIFRIGHLQYKETDRIAALVRELTKIGIEARLEKESLVVKGGFPRWSGDRYLPGSPDGHGLCRCRSKGSGNGDSESGLREQILPGLLDSSGGTGMNLVLIGFMGVGKTTVGRKVAERLGRPFIDTDTLIEEAHSMTITEIFERCGEKFFREKEKEVVAHVSKAERAVIATGGGAVLDPDNVALLKAGGVMIHLSLSLEKIFERIGHERTRPLLRKERSKQALETFYHSREVFYRACSDLTVDRNEMDVEETVEKILGEIRSWRGGEKPPRSVNGEGIGYVELLR